ncbi:phosphatidylinositol 3,4,5-trisphosphate 3-phosphatase and protein-tyrosine-phosphatase PTEN2A [Selaginella moellendorffii]|uniref:phosphatidylinositol 3,4,5-trisphosphate 3-phosphatase and protein-tyrosine-phosphatase PTEN2A n=1 Tax=Selaginella moellendorffii TaxID=88036 RepID=UPI000D1C5A4B|nr:phosphatidylinositol 3,4,5-trisphosphate 3-phosphatase and protein-tyrosine-phosphatase PTEN2A [Selaginella moellendorffii]XP_024533995.1 phosphatidylinositol 3,4,5-trisphosphate 3-phosphatase and protein-tyrosine-phosphatase PTEN2A [Selaginella moellendorffii]|eukprot:XP_024533990.1 phosphatidylinositol 3,4,5-trisphosphate 3-phosphatase and protein-tyrosine-phosphatase PTEN2A [Selaginella moellendorffii]
MESSPEAPVSVSVEPSEVPVEISVTEGAAAATQQRSKFYQRSASFFSRTAAATPGDGSTEAPSKLSVAGISTWAKSLKLPISPKDAKENSNASSPKDSKSPFSILSSGFGKRVPAKIPVVDDELPTTTAPAQAQDGAFGTFTKGFLDSSRNAVKVVQTRARHLVSQNKRRYQEGGFDLDMTYITDSIIAMGFPAGDMSSGILGYVEGFYRNHMEEVIRFFETQHKGKYKVYNLCSERLYDVSLLEGKVASFPFDDHNCPPLQLVLAFCRSAYGWLKENLDNVVVVHCKAGKARTGLMISCLLLYLKFFPTAEECIANYNERRCIDSKGLILPSQIRYVKYFERVLKEFNGETPAGRKCILRGIRLHRCPYWIRPAITVSDHNGILFSTKKHPRTKDMMPEDFWFSAPRRGIMVFALPGERCVADLDGDFKILFQDRHGDFYCWLNTTMMETRQILNVSDLDGFDKRRLPSPGFQVEVVILDPNASVPPVPPRESPPLPQAPQRSPDTESRENDDVFSDSEDGDSHRKENQGVRVETTAPKHPEPELSCGAAAAAVVSSENRPKSSDSSPAAEEAPKARSDKDESSDYVHVKEDHPSKKEKAEDESNDFRAIAADASVFTFGDEDDYASE